MGFLGAAYYPPTYHCGFEISYAEYAGLPHWFAAADEDQLAGVRRFFHKDIRNILGVAITNLAFAARLPGHTGETLPATGDQPINSYGPWYSGSYTRGCCRLPQANERAVYA